MSTEFERIAAMLQSTEKARRKQGLQKIFLYLESTEDKDQESWDTLYRSLSRVLNDSAEICRDLALEIFKVFLKTSSPAEKHIAYILPILSRRLGSLEQIETSEEVRLKSVNLLKIIISRYKDHLPAYVDDLTRILIRTLTDNYPLVKRESCECVCEYANNLPRHFYGQAEKLVKPILSNFNHQHHRIRVCSVKTVGVLILHGNGACIEQVATPMAERLFDQSGFVRLAVVQAAGRWLLEFKDRYSWWHKILPLLLTGLHDELEEIRKESGGLWDAAGKLYLEENQNDEKLKDKLDFLVEDLSHYPNVCRPNLGCRLLAQRNISKLINGIGLELNDWMADIRVRSAQLLCVLILNVEEDVIQHIEKLLPPMYRACNDEDKRVVQNVELAAEYLGYFINPQIHFQLIIPTLEESPSPGHLQFFAALIKGSEPNALSTKLTDVGKFLSQSHICQSKKPTYQKQVLSCCQALFSVCKTNCTIISEDLFKILFTVLSMSTESIIKNEAVQLLNTLANVNSFESEKELYRSYIDPLIASLTDCESWSVHSAESQIFSACLTYGKQAASMDALLPILKSTMSNDSDSELRLKHFILLSEYFNDVTIIPKFNELFKQFLEDCIISGLVWSAGRVAETMRTAAVSSICAFLQNYSKQMLKENDFAFLSDNVLPPLISLLDDNSRKSRLYSIKAISFILSIGRDLKLIPEKHILSLNPAILKRLEDGCDEVRYASLKILAELWSDLPVDYDVNFNRGHIDSLYTAAIIYLDDPETAVQHAMLDTLKTLAKIHPELLYQKLQNSKANFRNQEAIKTLLEHCQYILKQ